MDAEELDRHTKLSNTAQPPAKTPFSHLLVSACTPLRTPSIMVSQTEYSVTKEAQSVFEDGILANPLMKDLPPQLRDLSKRVRFYGSADPIIPINWRFAESISAIKALEATMLNLLLTRKYEIDPVDICINTYVHTQSVESSESYIKHVNAVTTHHYSSCHL